MNPNFIKHVPEQMGETNSKPFLNENSILRGPVCQIEKTLPVILKESFQAHVRKTAIIEAKRVKVTYDELLYRAMERFYERSTSYRNNLELRCFLRIVWKQSNIL